MRMAVLPNFIRQGRGIFINMISLGGFAPAPYATAYSASKFGLRGFEWAVQRSRYMTLETIATMSDDPLISLPAAS